MGDAQRCVFAFQPKHRPFCERCGFEHGGPCVEAWVAKLQAARSAFACSDEERARWEAKASPGATSGRERASQP